ncbi:MULTISPECIES: AMP-dependent synthetase/ligase [unclassified Nocardioides]|uniref:AMP-dependent synthetase/ligase n=1 Tax=unclassified Nocardioides TaxID=2615069 RepID=UPI00070119F8|nr:MULTISPECIES: long-chain fatty acid--CoA ligase [unclassified Nocardioides]KRA38891.1 AMP-dependent synthetase [Nocardioides sp. Root614]KRA92851.1 AMP-dependent synthetase [Nocardioides sp. Root682]
MATDNRTLCAAFQQTASARPDAVAVRTPDDSVALTWREYADRVRGVAAGLAALGVTRGDTVALMLTNRPEFHVVDTGALHVGATPFSIYNTLATDQITHLFHNAGNKVVITEQQFLEKLKLANPEGQVEHFVCIDGDVDGAMTLADLEAAGDPSYDFDAGWQAVETSDVLTLIYTSGTTGPPKGVELTHANLMAEMDALEGWFPLNHDDRLVSYLPDAHIANRWGAHYNNLRYGIQITTVDDPKQLVATLPSVRPTFFGAVPAVWYKVKAGIEAALAAEPDEKKRKIANWAIATGTKVAWLKSDGKSVPIALALQHAIAERLVLSKLRERMGLDQVRVAATGASAIAPDALAFMLALGVPVLEVWGMSETSAVVTMNPPDGIRIGTVGKVVPGGSEIMLAPDGELLVRGPLLMKGYRNDPVKTAEAIDTDGWMHTGDIATIDDEGYVRIVDRKKELIINAAGKNMSPQNIEGAVKVACPLVMSVVAIGDDRPYVTALLTLDPDACAAYGAKAGLADASPAVLAQDETVRALVQAGVDRANEKLARVEQIKKFALLGSSWEPGGDELTPTMKLKRTPIAKKYATEIDALYS